MPKHVVRLEVVGGSSKGQIVFLKDRETLIVGRLPECGLSFPEDLSVSRQHCRIEYEANQCRLIHLSQTGETFVNGASVANAELRTDDEISFGVANKIRASIEEMRDGLGTTTEVPSRPSSSEAEKNKAISVSIASCGWNLYESAEERPDHKELMKILMAGRKVFTVIDFRRTKLPIPPTLNSPHYLFPWMDAPIRDQFSPIMLSLADNPSIADAIDGGWEKDGVVFFGSELNGDELAAHWRRAIGASSDKPGDSMTAYFWPSILNMILTCQPPSKVAPLLDGLTWIFIESPDAPANWRLFSKDDFVPELTKAGFNPASPPAAKK